MSHWSRQLGHWSLVQYHLFNSFSVRVNGDGGRVAAAAREGLEEDKDGIHHA